MGFGEIRLIAAGPPRAAPVEPASTTTTPSSPTCTLTFAPAPAITKNDGRTSRTSRVDDGGGAAACGAAAFSGKQAPPERREMSAAQVAILMSRAEANTQRP